MNTAFVDEEASGFNTAFHRHYCQRLYTVNNSSYQISALHAFAK